VEFLPERNKKTSSKADKPKNARIYDLDEKFKRYKLKKVTDVKKPEAAISSADSKSKPSMFSMFKSFHFKKHPAKSQEEKKVPSENKKELIKGSVKLTGLEAFGEKREENVQSKPDLSILPKKKSEIKMMDSYDFISDNMPIKIKIFMAKGEFVPLYEVSISSISKTTEFILEKIREELTAQVSLGMVDILASKNSGIIEEKFIETISNLINKHFPDADEDTANFLKSYLIQRSLGLGSIEILMDDSKLEEIAVNNAEEPVWIYHAKWGWLKTNIHLQNEDQIRHYSTMIGRRVGRQITILEPLMDAHLKGGDRVNATLEPISSAGNTITLRKFASKPWTMTDFLRHGTISYEAASIIWLGIQFELSTLIAGGTASGKTSMLNAIASFFPPNQRILSIEDTREIQLPKFLHWIPMNTRLPNPEGKGEISMLDLLVNSLRMRPDRILVGEIRRKREAEVLFEAIHTGHSVYATVHANDANEVITRLTNEPIMIPKTMLPAISMIIVQYRNRRTGDRKTFQIAEILPNAEVNVLVQLDIKKGVLKKVSNSKSLFDTIELFTGFSRTQLNKSLKEKESVLKWLVRQNINTVNGVGRVMAEYYTNKDNLMAHVKKSIPLGD
jgi:archaeal flagellar protein FlaI